MIHVSHNVDISVKSFYQSECTFPIESTSRNIFCKNYYVEANCGKKFSLQCIINVINFENLP